MQCCSLQHMTIISRNHATKATLFSKSNQIFYSSLLVYINYIYTLYDILHLHYLLLSFTTTIKEHAIICFVRV